MEDALQAILTAARKPTLGATVATDSSFLLIYPPDHELDVRSAIQDRCYPVLAAEGLSHHEINLSDFLFACFDAGEIAGLCDDEFRNYRLMRQGLAARVERKLVALFRQFAEDHPGTNLFILSTVSLYPLVRYGEVLRELRDLPLRLFVSFPGEERGGKPHFLKEPDGGNYLATRITFNI